MEIIAKIYNGFEGKFGIPRQSGLIEAESVIVFEKKYRIPEALRGIEDYSHLWLIWQFSENKGEWSPTVRPPRLGGNTRVGVFATRSPFRPNSIGLSSVRLLGVEQTEKDGFILRVSGADLMSGTPIYDIKPYIAYSDSHPDATGGFSDVDFSVTVKDEKGELKKADEKTRSIILKILSGDPRPSYHADGKEYAFEYGGYKIEFFSENDEIIIDRIEKLS